MDNLKSESGEDYYGLFHESFSPLPIHVDSGFHAEDIIYKQVITPLTPIGDTIFFKKRWYGRSTTFTNNPEDLKFKPKSDQNDRSNEHLGNKEFDKEFLGEIPINPEVGKTGDEGKPIVEADPEHEISKIYLGLANKIKSTYL